MSVEMSCLRNEYSCSYWVSVFADKMWLLVSRLIITPQNQSGKMLEHYSNGVLSCVGHKEL